MSDPALVLGRLFALVLVPILLLFPLCFVLLVPNRASDDAARLKVRGALALLALCTLAALALWIMLLVGGLWLPWSAQVSGFAWVLFFPLWFTLGMRVMRAKNPVVLGEDPWVRAGGEVRTASLVNRERQSPVTRAMWAVPIAVFLLALGAIAVRGLLPFPMHAHGGENDAALAGAERARWLLTLAIYGVVFGAMLAILPYSLRRTLTEPEPMDAGGSPELAELYRVQRRRRVLGLFWGGGVLLPAFMGAVIALPVWFPDFGGVWGLVGGIGGSAIGIAGAAFGIWMSVERARIAQARVRMESARAAPTR